MPRKQETIDPVEMMIDAKRYLSEGRFFLALDIAGQVEDHLRELPYNSETQRLWNLLRPIIQEAWRETVKAVEEVLPSRKVFGTLKHRK